MVDGNAIKAEAKRRGWSQNRVAEEARQFVPDADREKLVQQVVGRVQRGGESKYRNAILQALDLLVVQPTISHANKASDVEDAPEAPPFKSLAGRLRDVPELGIAVGGSDGDFELNGKALGLQPRPPALIGRDIFAVRVRNDSMKPRFKDGELVYVERNREPAVGDDAIIEMRADDDARAGAAFIKEIVLKNNQVVIAAQHNPAEHITYKRRDIKMIYRVVPWNEAFGV